MRQPRHMRGMLLDVWLAVIGYYPSLVLKGDLGI